MEYFNKYISNSIAGTSNQSFFISDNENKVGRVVYKPLNFGKFNYSFLFSNVIDSTYADGEISHKNLILDAWQIVNLKATSAILSSDNKITECREFSSVLFSGSESKIVAPGEFFSSDPIELEIKQNEYLLLEIEFKGKQIPFHPEIIIPTYLKQGDGWVSSLEMPVPGMIGIERKVNKKIAFLGDSITQGIGTPFNSYEHYASVAANIIGNSYSYWNLGIGYGRAEDISADGAWSFKAKQNDIVVLCCGVNDILHGNRSADHIKNSIETVIDKLNEARCKILLQTIPPFSYSEDKKVVWENINAYILNVLSKKVAYVFDNRNILSDQNEFHIAKYGAHPNSEGCKLWGEALAQAILKIL